MLLAGDAGTTGSARGAGMTDGAFSGTFRVPVPARGERQARRCPGPRTRSARTQRRLGGRRFRMIRSVGRYAERRRSRRRCEAIPATPGAFDNPIRFLTVGRLGHHILMNATALPEQSSSRLRPPPCWTRALGDTADFSPSAPGYWPDVPPAQWNDWKWQLKNRVTTLEQLEQHLVLTPEERAGVRVAGSKLSLAITPHFFNLIDRDNPDCPIRRQVIPRLEESLDDALRDGRPVRRGQPHARARVGASLSRTACLFLVTDRCASYCRYCTRSRVVSGAGEQELHTEFRGGDPLPGDAHRSARRAAFRRRPAAVLRRQTRKDARAVCAPSSTSSSCGSARACRFSCRSASRRNCARCCKNIIRCG